MQPICTRHALVSLHDVAADHDNRHTVAPSVVDRHGRMLQADGAVTGHRNRRACDLGVALTHVHGDVLVHAGDDFRFVVAVIEDGFVQTAIARRAVDSQVLDAERVDHVGHEVAAAGRLIDWVAARRHGLGRDLPRAGNGGLQLRRRRDRQRVSGWRRDRGGCADQTSTLQEIAACSIR